MSVRFAPSPTGTFHIGNLRTAWISWRWSKELSLPWVVRFEDIDKPRVVSGALERQLNDMKSLGLKPDRVLVQSHRFQRHLELFESAKTNSIVYPCICSRREVLAELASAPHHPEAIYSGRCRSGADITNATQIAWRFRAQEPSGQSDFIVARTDSSGFTPSYHWACAIDDWEEQHQLLVRAHDLAHATLTQRQIMSWLRGSDTRDFPAVFHTSLVVGNDGSRLEKRTQGVTLADLPLKPSVLVERFENSFTPNRSEYSAGRVWGEAQNSIHLSQFGL